MTRSPDPLPACYGDLETVFPMGPEGLRHSPEACLSCDHKTPCLKTAMARKNSVAVHEELVDRAYDAGLMGFIERWSRKKTLSARKKTE